MKIGIPFNIGDKVWYVYYGAPWAVHTSVLTEIVIKFNNEIIMRYRVYDGDYEFSLLENTFKTKKEAEQQLKKLLDIEETKENNCLIKELEKKGYEIKRKVDL